MLEIELTNRITELEMKLAFQEKTIEDLNEALIQHQQTISKMQSQLRQLAQKLQGLKPSNIATYAEETPPPHY